MTVDASSSERMRDVERPVVVAWDTCTIRGALAVAAGGSLLAAEYFESVKGHTGWLMPQLKSTLTALGLSPSDIDFVAVGTGPGTFTGVKVGVACAKAVSFALKRPLLALPTLDLLAAAAPPAADTALCTIDARQGRLYAAAYKVVAGRGERLTDFQCVTPEEAALMVASTGFEQLAVVGESPGDLMRAVRRYGKAVVVQDRYPAAPALIELVGKAVLEGDITDVSEVSPIYLKKPT